MDRLKKSGQMFFGPLLYFIKWLLLAVVTGILTGLVGSVFARGLTFVTGLREQNPWLILGLPVGGLLIIWLYHVSHRDYDKGTNMVLEAVREQDRVPARITPLIFFGTLITHLFGGSAGREGAALQMGGSIGNGIARLLRLERKDINCMIMCGMSGAFSALFGTPMAAAVFSMEVVSVGLMYYAALVPCVVSSLVALGVAKFFGVHGEQFTILTMPEFLPDAAEAGTHNVLGIAGLSAGIDYVLKVTTKRIFDHERVLTRICAEELKHRGVKVFYPVDGEHCGGVLSFVPEFAEPQNFASYLSKRDICVRAGLHCAPTAHETAGTIVDGTVRLSFSAFSNIKEIHRFIEIVEQFKHA